MESAVEFDRELSFSEAVLDDKVRPYLDRLFTLLGCPALLAGKGGSLAINGFDCGHLDPAALVASGLPEHPRDYSSGNGERYRGIPVRHEGEPLFVLVVPESRGAGMDAAVLAGLLESYLELRHNQRMIAEVHHDTQDQGYRELVEKNRELAESERRYRELAENLEVRVQERTRDLYQAQKQLIQQEKMASIGQLAAGVAHEINNPNGFIRSNLATLTTYHSELVEMLDGYRRAAAINSVAFPKLEKRWKELDLDYILDDLAVLMEQSIAGTDRITRIVQGLSRFSHVDKEEIEAFDLNALLESALAMLNNEIKYKAELVRELAELPRMTGVPGQLNQVFVNLVINAVQAMDKPGRLWVRTRRADADAVEVEVEDNGSGIEPEHLNRLFDPFFTTKPVGKGTGLGLSISYEIVKNHGGDIQVRSVLGQGSAFTVRLPLQASFAGAVR